MNYCICVVKSASDDNVIFSTLKGMVQRCKKNKKIQKVALIQT